MTLAPKDVPHSLVPARTRRLEFHVVSAMVPLALLAMWELGTRYNWLPRTLVSSPSAVAEAMLRLGRNGALVHHSLVSLRRLSLGFGSGSLLAVLIGTFVGLSKAFDRVMAPTLSFLAPVPVSAWIPLIIILFGIGEVAKCSVIAVGAFFVVYFGTVSGIRSTDPKLVEVARVCGKTPTLLVTQVLLPSALASILQAMRGALALGWVLLVIAEVIASTEGLGWLMWDARQYGRADEMIVGVAMAGALGATTDWIARRIQRRVLIWRPAFEGQ